MNAHRGLGADREIAATSVVEPFDPHVAAVRRSRLSQILDSPYLLLALVLVVAFAFYAPTLGYWFFFDDFFFLRASQSTAPDDYIRAAFDYRTVGPVPEILYRPLYVVTFLGLFQLFGLHAWAYHLFGIVVHLLNVVLLWWIARKITGRWAVAHAAAFIFALHPTYAAAVAMVTNNIVVIATFAYLCCLGSFIKHLDGDRGRWLWYAGALVAFVAALLLHPETSHLFVVLVLSYLLLSARSFDDIRSPGSWVRFVPFLLVEAGFLVVQLEAREFSTFQSSSFQPGWHIAENYVRYAALAMDPFRAAPTLPFQRDLTALTAWRTLLPAAAGAGAAVYLLATERRRPRAGTFAVAWTLLAMLPLATWVEGAYARKLYTAGPAFALMLAVVGVSLWDRAAKETRTLGAGRGQFADDVLRSPPSLLHETLMLLRNNFPLAAILVAVALGVRVGHITQPVGEQSRQYKDLVDELRRQHPTIPEGSRLYLVEVPWPLLVYGEDSAGLASAVRLYYGDVPLAAVSHRPQLAMLPVPPSTGDVVVEYRCPPICQPPLR